MALPESKGRYSKSRMEAEERAKRRAEELLKSEEARHAREVEMAAIRAATEKRYAAERERQEAERRKELEELQAIAETGEVSEGVTEPCNYPVMLNAKGREVIAQLVACYPDPVLLLGNTGWGKSVIVREASGRVKQDYSSINAYPGMDIATIVGMWRPHNTENGIEVVWEDGIMSRAVRLGHAFLFEELTRAPQEAVSRLHGVLDTKNRYWSLPEAGEQSVPVHPKFWFLATANPAGKGYASQNVERALMSRFVIQIDINGPVADEEGVITYILKDAKRPEDALKKTMVNRMLKVALDSRKNEDTQIPTRELVQWAMLVRRGFSAKLAFELGITVKHAKSAGLSQIFKLHFGDF